MKVIFIYGPPAVGKLTVAKALADLTGFKLLHNHLTVDVVTAIFEHGSEPYYRLVRKMRFMMIEEAAQASIDGMIMTYVYGTARRAVVEQYEDVVKDNGGEMCWVRLYCDEATLIERVANEDRSQYGKISSAEKLTEKLGELGNPFAEIDGKPSLSVDIGQCSAVEAAENIQRHYQLPVI